MNLATVLKSLDTWLEDVRTDARKRRLFLVGGFVVGLALAWLHWTGLVVGGGLVGLSRRTVRWALLAGLAFGTCATVVSVVLVSTVGPAEFVGLRRLTAITAVVGLGTATWGGLLRAVV